MTLETTIMGLGTNELLSLTMKLGYQIIRESVWTCVYLCIFINKLLKCIRINRVKPQLHKFVPQIFIAPYVTMHRVLEHK